MRINHIIMEVELDNDSHFYGVKHDVFSVVGDGFRVLLAIPPSLHDMTPS